MSNEIKKYDEYIFKDGEYRRVASGNGSGVIIRYVDELPAVGEPGIIYVLNGGGGDEPEGNDKIIIKKVFLTENMLTYDFNGNNIEEDSEIANKLQAENIGQDKTILATRHLVLNIITEPINDDLVNKINDGKVYLRWEHPKRTKKKNTIFRYSNAFDYNDIDRSIFLITPDYLKEKNGLKYIHYFYDLSNWYHKRINEALANYSGEEVDLNNYDYFDYYKIEDKRISVKNMYPWSLKKELGIYGKNFKKRGTIPFKEQQKHYEKKKNITFFKIANYDDEKQFYSILTDVFWGSYINNHDYWRVRNRMKQQTIHLMEFESHGYNFSISNVNLDRFYSDDGYLYRTSRFNNILFNQPCYDVNHNFWGYRSVFNLVHQGSKDPIENYISDPDKRFHCNGIGKKLGEKIGFNFAIAKNNGEPWEKVFPHGKFILINRYSEYVNRKFQKKGKLGTLLEIQNWIRKLPY